jgi:CBS domain-containing protein
MTAAAHPFGEVLDLIGPPIKSSSGVRFRRNIRRGSQAHRPGNRPEEVATMPKTARDVMTPNAECVGENETLLEAARKMADRGFGSMPICGEDNRLKGMLTDRDIVTKALAQGKDPASTRAGELGEGKPVTIGADDSLSEALRTMAQHKVRRLPVIDGHDLVGIVAVADIARELEDDSSKGDLIEAISEGPPQQGVGPQ